MELTLLPFHEARSSSGAWVLQLLAGARGRQEGIPASWRHWSESDTYHRHSHCRDEHYLATLGFEGWLGNGVSGWAAIPRDNTLHPTLHPNVSFFSMGTVVLCIPIKQIAQACAEEVLFKYFVNK